MPSCGGLHDTELFAQMRIEQLQVAAVGFEHEVGEIAEHRHDAEQRIEEDVADHFRQQSARRAQAHRSEEHTSELQSLMRISYAVFCLKKKQTNIDTKHSGTMVIR